MGLIKKLLGISSEESEKENIQSRRVENKRKLEQFLKKTGRKHNNTYLEDLEDPKDYDKMINYAGKKAYDILEKQYPQYQKIAEKDAPKVLEKKQERDNKICELASNFIDFINLEIEHGIHNLEYGIIDRQSPVYNPQNPGKYGDQAMNRIISKFNLPLGFGIENIQKMKNVSLEQASGEVENCLEGFVGYVTFSGIAEDIANTERQIEALDHFRTGICRKVREFIDNEKDIMQAHYDTRKEGNLSKETRKAFDDYKRKVNKIILEYTQKVNDLKALGINEEANINGIKEYVQKLINFVSERGEYTLETSKDYETKIPEGTSSDPGFDRFRETKLIKMGKVDPRQTETKEMSFEEFTKKHKTKKKDNQDTSVFWKNNNQENQ
ncbi:hypothetical protein GF378_02405 [Candidatus Pacearchaeota archaeon]|nr:hypothetical protein [Candidatus Pacearchaeota archaeon]